LTVVILAFFLGLGAVAVTKTFNVLLLILLHALFITKWTNYTNYRKVMEYQFSTGNNTWGGQYPGLQQCPEGNLINLVGNNNASEASTPVPANDQVMQELEPNRPDLGLLYNQCKQSRAALKCVSTTAFGSDQGFTFDEPAGVKIGNLDCPGDNSLMGALLCLSRKGTNITLPVK
jgi:hypothetical protein